ncbi:hypothetical protein NEOKW01_1985 [Nematocida sp. AWRm80]|nr:hypothetical protein NEOKW01_1985 [Nematocida sp. AWRm80]
MDRKRYLAKIHRETEQMQGILSHLDYSVNNISKVGSLYSCALSTSLESDIADFNSSKICLFYSKYQEYAKKMQYIEHRLAWYTKAITQMLQLYKTILDKNIFRELCSELLIQDKVLELDNVIGTSYISDPREVSAMAYTKSLGYKGNSRITGPEEEQEILNKTCSMHINKLQKDLEKIKSRVNVIKRDIDSRYAIIKEEISKANYIPTKPPTIDSSSTNSLHSSSIQTDIRDIGNNDITASHTKHSSNKEENTDIQNDVIDVPDLEALLEIPKHSFLKSVQQQESAITVYVESMQDILAEVTSIQEYIELHFMFGRHKKNASIVYVWNDDIQYIYRIISRMLYHTSKSKCKEIWHMSNVFFALGFALMLVFVREMVKEVFAKFTWKRLKYVLGTENRSNIFFLSGSGMAVLLSILCDMWYIYDISSYLIYTKGSVIVGMSITLVVFFIVSLVVINTLFILDKHSIVSLSSSCSGILCSVFGVAASISFVNYMYSIAYCDTARQRVLNIFNMLLVLLVYSSLGYIFVHYGSDVQQKK